MFLPTYDCTDKLSHIKFNGATFGTPFETFKKELKGLYDTNELKDENIYNRDICKCYRGSTQLNVGYWQCLIFSSLKTKTVFRTVCMKEWDLNAGDHLKLLIEALERKYGEHKEEKQPDLGHIRIFLDTYKYNTYEEQSALRYTIRNLISNIGEIRISVNCYNEKMSGRVELSYIDYNASNIAHDEYDAIINETL